ncbi:MAG: heavy-metal-associated domain-containing protein [bacterium]|nr:heavy-metal-associated domain-containing protein [bacterium]
MHCERCVDAVRNKLGELPGVIQVAVSLGKAEIEFDESVCTVADVLTAVRATDGFEVAGFQTGPTE